MSWGFVAAHNVAGESRWGDLWAAHNGVRLGRTDSTGVLDRVASCSRFTPEASSRMRLFSFRCTIERSRWYSPLAWFLFPTRSPRSESIETLRYEAISYRVGTEGFSFPFSTCDSMLCEIPAADATWRRLNPSSCRLARRPCPIPEVITVPNLRAYGNHDGVKTFFRRGNSAFQFIFNSRYARIAM